MESNPIRVITRRMTTAQLVEDFIETGKENDPEYHMLRCWFLDEIRRREPEAYKAWISLDCPLDEDLRGFIR